MTSFEPTQVVVAAMDPVLVGFGFAGIVILVYILALVFGRRCPQCERLNALRKTGAKRREGSFLFGERYEEWLCQYCDHRVWKEIPTPHIANP